MQHQHGVTVASGTDTSTPIDLAEQVMNIVVFPGALTSSTFGFDINLTDAEKQSEVPTTGWKTVVDTAGAALSYACSADDAVSLDWSSVFGARWVRINMGSNEGADREIVVFTQAIG